MTDEQVKRYFARALTDTQHHQLLDLLARTDAALNAADLTYVLVSGGLLGHCMYGDVLPWDDDLDLLVLSDPSRLHVQGARVRPHQRHMLKVFDPTYSRIRRKWWTAPFIDLATCHRTADGWQHDDVWGGVLRVPDRLLYPIKRGQLGGVSVNLPHDPAGLCLHNYGPHCLTTGLPSKWSHLRERHTGYPQLRVDLERIRSLHA